MMKKNILSLVLWGVLITTLLYAGLKDWETNPLQYITYDSGWFYITNNSNYTKSHNLNAIPKIVLVYVADDVNGGGMRTAIWLSWYYSSGYPNYNRGTRVRNITSTSFEVETGGGIDSDRTTAEATGGTGNVSSGYCRVVAIK